MKERFIPLLACWLMLSGCGPLQQQDYAFNPQYRAFFLEMSSAQRIERFRLLGMEEQYQTFLFGNQVVHPPATYLATPFAKRGSALEPFLKNKLALARTELTIRDIAVLAEELAKRGALDDDSLIDALEARALTTKSLWKDTTLRIIESARQSRGKAGSAQAPRLPFPPTLK
jgi:hypothetical protein